MFSSVNFVDIGKNKNKTSPCRKLADPSVLLRRLCSHRIDLSSEEYCGKLTSTEPSTAIASSAILNLQICSRAHMRILISPRVRKSRVQCSPFLSPVHHSQKYSALPLPLTSSPVARLLRWLPQRGL